MTPEKCAAAMDYLNFVAAQRIAQGYDTLLLEQLNNANFIAGRPLITPNSPEEIKLDIIK
jgi:hypothetical protein